jgi:transcriptional regulator with XRE-family HTH domain
MPPRTGVDPALAATLRALRQARGIGQETLAHHAGLSVATYARIERSQVNPTWTTVRRVLDALGISLAELGAAIDSRTPSPITKRSNTRQGGVASSRRRGRQRGERLRR